MINNKYREKLRYLILFLIMCVAFSIPFGEVYGKKILTIAFILWLLWIRMENVKNILKNKILLILFLFISSHLFTLYLSSNIELGLHFISQMYRYLFIPVIIYVTIIKKGEIKYILYSFVLSMFINEIISYLIYFDLYETEISKMHHYPVGFINHIQYSVLVAFSSILILYQAKKMKRSSLKIVYIIFFITMTTNLVISGGRTGYVIYFVSLFILLFVYYRFNIKNFLQILIFPIIIFFIAYKFNAPVQARIQASLNDFNKVNQNKNYNTSFGTRLSFYPISYDMLKQEENSFIFGLGIGDLENELHKAIVRTKLISTKYDHVHSSFLTAYLTGGLLSLFLLLLFLYSVWVLEIRNDEMLFIKYLFVLNFSIGMIPDIILTQRTTMIYFSLFIGIIISQNIIENKTKNSETKQI